MLVKRNLLSRKRKYLYGLVLLAFVAVICVGFGIKGNEEFDMARREVLLRSIGHEILLQSGDSTSRVLPVKKITENEYRISFEHAFTFQPQFLMTTTRRLLAKDPLAGDYVVNVLNCADSSVAYGYALSKNKKNDIITCIGRQQPKAGYMIHIKFEPAGLNTAKKGYFLGAFLLLAFVGFIALRSFKPRPALLNSEDTEADNKPTEPDRQDTGMFTLGSVLFDAGSRKLIINEKTTDLTGTETRVLRIFALSPNEAIERSRLQKEVWEDEGVIVGRSLDMFISKLRKKLEPDPNIKIAVIRGKGYKLEISA